MIYWTYNSVSYVTLKQFASLCSVAVTTVHYWCGKGLPYMQLDSKTFMIPVDPGIKWVKKNAPKAAANI